MRVYDKIVETPFEPQSTNVIWLRPTGDGFSFYRYINGHWEALKIMDDKGTATPDDDTEIDTTDLPTKETVEEMVQEEVTEQIGTQVEDMTKIEAEACGDTTEYTDYSSLFTTPSAGE